MPVINMEVEIMAYAGKSGPRKIASARSDEHGAFQFADLPIRGVTGFRVEADHDGVRYSSDWATLAAERKKAIVPLQVRRSTDDASTITVQRNHIMVDVDEGVLYISEVVLARNSGDMTVVSTDDSQGTFRLSLPDGIERVQLSGGFEEDNSTIAGGHAIYKGAFKPGMKQFVLQYILPLAKSTFTFTRVLDYDTLAADFIFPDTAATRVTGKGFDEQRRTNMGTKPYHYLSAKEREAGSKLAIDITVPIPPDNVFRWPALAVAIVAVAVFTAGSAFRRMKQQPGANSAGGSSE